MTSQAQATINFGNWVSIRTILAPTVLAAVCAGLAFLTPYLLVPAGIFLFVAGYFLYARYLFSPKGGNIQERIHSLVLENLTWDGKGKALDIGCGSAALTIDVARKFPSSNVVGTDYWGGNWEYSQRICQTNAELMQVVERVDFQKASASSLPFPDGEFDAVVSNLVFHEVKDTANKIDLIKEALRVLKKGGKFALQDLFYLRRLYGDPAELVKTIEKWGARKVELKSTKDVSFIPTALKLPFMVGTLGLISGER